MAKTKGTNLVDMVKFLRTQREAALELLPRRLHLDLEEQLRVTAWYPEEDMIELVRVLAKLLPGSGEDALVRIRRSPRSSRSVRSPSGVRERTASLRNGRGIHPVDRPLVPPRPRHLQRAG